MKIVVYHSLYGCETGCCGHYIESRRDDDTVIDSAFEFGHPNVSEKDPRRRRALFRRWAEDLVCDKYGADHVADLDWDSCQVIDDD